jgi:anti-sigma B factor antagonist
VTILPREVPVNEPSDENAVAVEKKGDALIARPQVKMMDDVTLRRLARSIDDASESDPGISLVILDLSRVAIVPSMALGLLLQTLNKCTARQQRLKLAAVQPQIRKVLTLTRLDQVFELADSVEAASE